MEPKFKNGEVVMVNLSANTMKPANWKRATITSVHLTSSTGNEFTEPVYGTSRGVYHESDIRAKDPKEK